MRAVRLKDEINHIIESGANEIRLTELFERYAIEFLEWKEENFQPYDSHETWINLKTRQVFNTKNLFKKLIVT